MDRKYRHGHRSPRHDYDRDRDYQGHRLQPKLERRFLNQRSPGSRLPPSKSPPHRLRDDKVADRQAPPRRKSPSTDLRNLTPLPPWFKNSKSEGPLRYISPERPRPTDIGTYASLTATGPPWRTGTGGIDNVKAIRNIGNVPPTKYISPSPVSASAATTIELTPLKISDSRPKPKVILGVGYENLKKSEIDNVRPTLGIGYENLKKSTIGGGQNLNQSIIGGEDQKSIHAYSNTLEPRFDKGLRARSSKGAEAIKGDRRLESAKFSKTEVGARSKTTPLSNDFSRASLFDRRLHSSSSEAPTGKTKPKPNRRSEQEVGYCKRLKKTYARHRCFCIVIIVIAVVISIAAVIAAIASTV